MEVTSFNDCSSLDDHITTKEHESVLQDQVRHMSQTQFAHEVYPHSHAKHHRCSIPKSISEKYLVALSHLKAKKLNLTSLHY